MTTHASQRPVSRGHKLVLVAVTRARAAEQRSKPRDTAGPHTETADPRHVPRRDRVRASASKSCIRRFVITEKAPTRAFSWLKAVVAAFNQEKALVGAFSVITNLRMQFGWNFLKHYQPPSPHNADLLYFIFISDIWRRNGNIASPLAARSRSLPKEENVLY